MRHTPMRHTPMRHTPMRHTPTTRALGARLTRFLDHERRERMMGRHRAVDDLHRRPQSGAAAGEAGARLRQFLRIERGRTA